MDINSQTQILVNSRNLRTENEIRQFEYAIGDGLLYERKEKDKQIRYYYDEEAKLIAEAEVKPDGSPKLLYVYIYDLGGQLWAHKDKITGAMQYYQFNGHGDVIGLTDSKGTELTDIPMTSGGTRKIPKKRFPISSDILENTGMRLPDFSI